MGSSPTTGTIRWHHFGYFKRNAKNTKGLPPFFISNSALRKKDIFALFWLLGRFELPLLRFQGQNSKKRPFCGRRIERFFLKISYDLSGVCLLVSSKPSNRCPFSFHYLIHHPAGAFLGCSGLFFCLRGGLHNERSERNRAASFP